jgi:two-component system, sensor histidine kinase PdtaS
LVIGKTSDKLPLDFSSRAVLTVVTALCLFLAALIALLFWQTRSDSIRNAKTSARFSALVVAADVDWLVNASIRTLEELDLLNGGSFASLTAASKQSMAQTVKKFPANATAAVFDVDGHNAFTTSVDEKFSADVKVSEDDFVALKAGEMVRFSSLLIDAKTGKQSFVVSRRLIRNGAFAGIVALSIPSDILFNLWTSLGLGANSTVGIIRNDGMLVARYPPPTGPLNMKDYKLFTDLLPKSDSGTYDAVSPVDGVSRIVGYRKTHNGPFVVIASISIDFAMREFWHFMGRISSILIPLVAGICGLLYWLSQILKREQRQRHELALTNEQNSLLLCEIHHRVKNNLQAVSSLFRLQPIPEEMKEAMANCINTMKHAFKDTNGAKIRISLKKFGSGKADLTISDNGKGFNHSAQHKGMGSRLIRSFAAQLGNDFAYQTDNGTTFRLRFEVGQKMKSLN